MQKTTVYLPEQLKRALTLSARRQGVSEAELIRRAVEAAVLQENVRPTPGVLSGSEPIAERVDELLVGFGER